jgi:hypothetical protein
LLGSRLISYIGREKWGQSRLSPVCPRLSLSGNNPTIQANWAAIEAGWSYQYDMQSNLDLSALWSNIQTAFQVAGQAIDAVVTIVGLFE